MFTTCPACRMNLAVTARDLRLGQGYVRCGRCERVFNALMSLADDLDQEEQSGLAAHGTTSLPAIQAEDSMVEVQEEFHEPEAGLEAELEPEAEPELEPEPEPEPERQQELDSALDPAASGVRYGNVDVTDSAGTGTIETIVLEGDTYLQTEEHLDEAEVRERLRDFTVEIKPPPSLHEIDADAAVGNPPRTHWAWRVAAAVLLLALAGQIIHHHRQALVTRPWLEKPLRAVYWLVGVELEPAWDLAAYDLRQLGGKELDRSSSTIVLRASVQNRAPYPQPPPLIRVRLEDGVGNVLSTTDLTPGEYLGQSLERLAPDQRLDVELHLQDADRQAMGFDLDACLPDADGKPHCAHGS